MTNIITYFSGKVKKWKRERDERSEPEFIEQSKLKVIRSVNEVTSRAWAISWKEWWLEFENGRVFMTTGESYKVGAYYNIFKDRDGSYSAIEKAHNEATDKKKLVKPLVEELKGA